jgi:propanediol dehydratase large subunit
MGKTNDIVGEEVFSPNMITAASLIEGGVSLRSKDLSSPILSKKANEVMNRINLGIDVVNAANSSDLKDIATNLLSTNNSTISEQYNISTPKDNAQIAPLVRPVRPVIIHYQDKKTEQHRTSKKGE